MLEVIELGGEGSECDDKGATGGIFVVMDLFYILTMVVLTHIYTHNKIAYN